VKRQEADLLAVDRAFPTDRSTQAAESSAGTARFDVDAEASASSVRMVYSGSHAPNDAQVPRDAHAGSNLQPSSEPPPAKESSTLPSAASGESEARDTHGDAGFGDSVDVDGVGPGLFPVEACVLWVAAIKAARHHHAATSLKSIANPEAVFFGEVWSRSFAFDCVRVAVASWPCAVFYCRLLIRRGSRQPSS